MRFHSQSYEKSGFTLLETVIAIGIILFGLLSILTLSTSSLVVSNVTSDEFLAANFAREGIEIIRTQRDTNWLKFDSDSTTEWDDGLSAGTNYSALVSFDAFDLTGSYLDFRPEDFGDTCPGASSSNYDCTAIWFDPATNLYIQTTQSTFDSTMYTQTDFSRLVYTYPVCRNDSDETDEVVVTSGLCAAGYTKVGIDAQSVVEWPGRNNITSTYTLEEYIYDWKF